ncbi:MAG: hypothetical protein KAT71_05330, partial [Gammaproteobacteria bacterium]|nr:hypothetical protein [Gammaproteobacteria bacterium]
NRLDLVEYLLMRCKDLLLNSLNMNGETPLHLAVQQGNQAIYDLLVAAGADKTSLDYVGNSLAMQAFIYDTYVKIAEFHNIEALLILPGFLSEFKKLEVIFAEQPEFVAKQLRIVTHERDIRLYCHKLIVLFGSADLGWQYIQAHSSAESRQPIHDLCLFNLPPANLKWDRSAWAALALQHGTQLTEYLNFAPRIEALLGSKPPNSLQAIIAVASDIRYNREAENPELANLFIKYKIPESAFDRVLDAYRLKAEDKMPDLSIDGAVVGESHYYFKKLAPNDLRGFVLGAITHCCQSVGSAGEACVRHGMTSSYAGFYAVFKRPNQKEVARVGRLIDSAKAVSNLPDFLKNLPKDQSKKYAGAKSLDVLRAEFAAELERVSKDELVAQLFACLTNQGSLLFDSWEGLRVADNYLCKKFLVEAARKVIVNHRIPKVLLGKGGRTPADLQFTTADKPETPIDYVDYRDSKEQFIVATQEGLQNAVATTRARTAENLVQHSAVFAGPPGHNPEQMMMQMKEFCGAATNIDVLPFVRDPNPDCSNLKGYLDQDISAEKVILLPIYKENNSWTCLFARLYPDRSKYVAYLDPLATSSHVPNYLSSCISDNHSIAKTTAEYVEDPAQTGSWLIDVMRNFVATGQLVMYSSAFAGCLGRKLETECVSGPI